MSNLDGPFHQLFCIVNSGGTATDLFKPMGYRTLCINTNQDSRDKYNSTAVVGGGLEKLHTEGFTTCLKADGIFHLASHRVTDDEQKVSELSNSQKSPRAKCDLSDEGGAYTVEICGVLEQIVYSPGKSVSMYILGSDKSPRSRFVQSRLLRWVSDWALKQQSWWATMNYSCTLLPSDTAPIELSRTTSPVLRNQDIIDSMSLARTNLKNLLLKRPEISRSLCNTVYTMTLSDGKKEEKTSEIIVVESHGWQTIDMTERDYQRALCVILELEPSYGFGLKPGEQQLLKRLQKATYRSTFLCLSAIENEMDSVEEINMFELGKSLTNAAHHERRVETLKTIIANQQAEIVLQGKTNKVLERTNETLINSTAQVRKQREIIEKQKRKFDSKKSDLQVVITGLKAKTRFLEKPSPFVEMYKKAEERRREEVGVLTKEITQLRVLSKDHEQNVSSLTEVHKVLRAADALEAERKLKVWKKTFKIGVSEISHNMSINKVQEKDHIAVIEHLGQAIELFEERAIRDKDIMKNLLKYSEQFNDDLWEASSTIKKLDLENEALRHQVRIAKKDLRKNSSYVDKILVLKVDLKDQRAKLRECKKRKKDLKKDLEAMEEEMGRKEKELEKRDLDLEKRLDVSGTSKKEAAGERQTRSGLKKKIESLEKKLKKTQMELDSKKRSTEKERKAIEKQINSGLKDSSKLSILRKELEMQKKMLSDMKASKKEIVALLKEEKQHLQKENADLQAKLNSQEEKILELQRLQAEVSILNLSRAEPDNEELTTLKSRVVELKGRQALFISKVGKQKEKISNLKKENARLLAELEEGVGGEDGDEKIQKLSKKLKESKKLLKKNEERRRDLQKELTFTKTMFAQMEKDYKIIKKEKKMLSKVLDKLKNAKQTQHNDVTRDSVDIHKIDGTPKSERQHSEQQQALPRNSDNPPAVLTPIISKEKAKRRLLHKRKLGLITASKTSGASASSFFHGNVDVDPIRKDRRGRKRKRKI